MTSAVARSASIVTLAKAGVSQRSSRPAMSWMPAFAGMTRERRTVMVNVLSTHSP